MNLATLFAVLILAGCLTACSPCGVWQICPQPCIDVPCANVRAAK